MTMINSADSNNHQCFITVFTPTYNRAYRLNALYKSLCSQTDKNFEWLIVDDGSIDNTEELVKHWIVEDKITIRYISQVNGGKHRAINHGVQEAIGTLFFIVDSDDILPMYSIELIDKHYQKIMNRPEFGGLCGLKAYYDGRCVGNASNFGEYECSNYDIRYKYGIKGDLAEVFYTSVLKENLFPEIDGEKFCPEALVWNRIANKYIIHYFSEVIYYCEYLNDGLTAKITSLRHNASQASMIYYSELFNRNIPYVQKIKSAINFWRFKHKPYRKNYRMHTPLALLCYVPGLIMGLKDRFR